jgi:hypothetical protein
MDELATHGVALCFWTHATWLKRLCD